MKDLLKPYVALPAGALRHEPLVTRLAARIDWPGNDDECWPWRGNLWRGYGRIMVNYRNVRAHRVAYEILVGPIPAGLELDHLCHNRDLLCPGGFTCPHRACCNPAHLEAVSTSTNILRGMSPAAKNARKSECGRGHAFTPGNSYISSRGTRQCRACHNARQRVRRERRS